MAKGLLRMRVGRGQASWNYLLIMFAIVVGIEGVVIMAWPKFPYNVGAFLAALLLTIYGFFASAWFQNKVIGFKNWIESRQLRIGSD